MYNLFERIENKRMSARNIIEGGKSPAKFMGSEILSSKRYESKKNTPAYATVGLRKVDSRPNSPDYIRPNSPGYPRSRPTSPDKVTLSPGRNSTEPTSPGTGGAGRGKWFGAKAATPTILEKEDFKTDEKSEATNAKSEDTVKKPKNNWFSKSDADEIKKETEKETTSKTNYEVFKKQTENKTSKSDVSIAKNQTDKQTPKPADDVVKKQQISAPAVADAVKKQSDKPMSNDVIKKSYQKLTSNETVNAVEPTDPAKTPSAHVKGRSFSPSPMDRNGSSPSEETTTTTTATPRKSLALFRKRKESPAINRLKSPRRDELSPEVPTPVTVTASKPFNAFKKVDVPKKAALPSKDLILSETEVDVQVEGQEKCTIC